MEQTTIISKDVGRDESDPFESELVSAIENNKSKHIDFLKNNKLENNPKTYIEHFLSLADIYYEENQYIEASTLYHTVLAIYKKFNPDPDENSKSQVIDKIARLEINFLKSIENFTAEITKTDIDAVIKKYQSYRDELGKIRNSFETSNNINFLNEINFESIDKIKKSYADIANSLVGFIKLLFDDAIEILGKPPCEYAVIGLGSLAHDEMTLYSDLEFAILIGNEVEGYKPYFRNITNLVHLSIIALGETLLPTRGIKLFNDFYSADLSDNWFYDTINSRGLAFDAEMPNACKTPLGKRDRIGNLVYELIHAPYEMVKFQSDSWLSREKMLPLLLSEVKYICGEQNLVNSYKKLLEIQLDRKISIPVRRDVGKLVSSPSLSHFSDENKTVLFREHLALTLLKSVTSEFGPKFDELNNSHLLHIKRDFYRLLNTTLHILALYYNVRNKSIWDKLDDLKEQGIFDEKAVSQLKIATAIVAGLRLFVYAHYKKQYDIVLVEPVKENLNPLNTNKYFKLENNKLIFQFYYTALPFYQAVCSFSLGKFTSSSFLKDKMFFANDPISEGVVYFKLTNYKQAKELFLENFDANNIELLQYLGGVHECLADIVAAVKYYRLAWKKMQHYYQTINLSKNVESGHSKIPNLLNKLGGAYLKLQNYKKAIMYCEQALMLTHKFEEKSASNAAPILSNLGLAYAELGRHEQARKFIYEALTKLVGLYGNQPCNDTASILQNLAYAFYKAKEFKEAIRYYKQSLVIFEKIYPQSNSPSIAKVYNSLGLTYKDKGEYQEAKKNFDEAFKIFKESLGENHFDTQSVQKNILSLSEGINPLENKKDIGQDKNSSSNLINMPELIPFYQERKGCTQSISEHIHRNKMVAITGLAGSGKTQLAIHYAYNYATENPNAKVCWLNAETLITLFRDYKKLAEALHLDSVDYDKSKNYSDIILSICNKLTSNFLLIYDNASGYRDIEIYLDANFKLNNVNIIVTSQNQHFFLDDDCKNLNIGGFSHDEAINFLLGNVIDKQNSIESAKELAAKLDYQPLALTAAKFYVGDSLSIKAYLQLLDDELTQKVIEEEEEQYFENYRPTDARTIHTALQLSISRSGEDAQSLLYMCTLISIHKIPTWLLKEAIKYHINDNNYESKFNEALKNLQLYSLITSEGEQCNFIALHLLVQKAAKRMLSLLPQRRKAILDALLTALNIYFTKDTHLQENYERNEILLPHVDALIETMNIESLLDKVSAYPQQQIISLVKLLDVRAHVCTQMGKAQQSADIFIQAKKLCECLVNFSYPSEDYSEEYVATLYKALKRIEILPELYVSICYSLGRVYFYKREEFIKTASKNALKIARSICGMIEFDKKIKIFHQFLVESNGLLYFYLEEDDGDDYKANLLEAASKYKTFLEDKTQYFHWGKPLSLNNDYTKLVCHHQLARIYHKLAQLPQNITEECGDYYQQALDHINETINLAEPAVTGGGFLRLAHYYNTYGDILIDNKNPHNNLECAIDFYKKALNLEQAKNGGKGKLDFPLADAHAGLALAYFKNNNLEKAKYHITDCIKVRRGLYPETHKELQAVLNLQKNIQESFVSLTAHLKEETEENKQGTSYLPKTDASKPLLKAQLPDTQEKLEFEELEISGGKDCGFITLSTDRKQVVTELLVLTNNAEDREFLAVEIQEAFSIYMATNGQEGLIPPDKKTWADLVKANQDAETQTAELFEAIRKKIIDKKVKSLDRDKLITWLKKNHQSDKAKKLTDQCSRVSKAESALENYCIQPEVFAFYVKAFENTGLRLGYKSALLYAKQANIALYIWRKDDSNSLELDLIGHHCPQSGAVTNTIHMLHTRGFTHFNLLAKPASQKKKKLQLEVSPKLMLPVQQSSTFTFEIPDDLPELEPITAPIVHKPDSQEQKKEAELEANSFFITTIKESKKMVSSHMQQLLNELKQSPVPDSYPLQVKAFTALAEEYLAQGEYLYAMGLYNYLLNLAERHPEALKDNTLTDKKKSSTDQQIKDIFQAIQENDEEKFEALLKAVDINTQSSVTNYVTALHHAAAHGNETVINMLLAAGADPTLQVNGETASQWATQNNRPEIAKLLDKAVADRKDITVAKFKAEHQAKLQAIEAAFIQNLGLQASANSHSYAAVNNKHRGTLQDLRAWCQSELTKIDSRYSFDIYGEEKMKGQEEEAHQLQLKRAEAIRDLYHTIAKKMKAFIRQLVDECIAVLGQPPCDYAIIGLGSLAREEMTPYSDLEFAILIEEEREEYKKYFRNLTKLLHLKVINLGETILPALGIPGLNNYYSKDPLDRWFFDNITTRGFAFDGAMPQACKTPLGKKGSYELIDTPAKIAKFFGKKIGDPEDIYWFDHEPHLTMILMTTTLITGSSDLLKTYQRQIQEALSQPHTTKGKPLHQVWTLHLLIGEGFEEYQNKKIKGDIQEFRLNPRDESEEGKVYDVKKEIYRLSDRALERLAIYYGINKPTLWERLECLGRLECLNEDGIRNLKTACGIATELRLRAYAVQGRQYDVMQIAKIGGSPDAFVSKVQYAKFYLPNVSQLLRFYYTALPFYQRIADFCEASFRANNQLVTAPFFIQHVFFDSACNTRAAIYKRLQLYPRAKDHYEKWLGKNPNDLLALADLGSIFYKLGDFKKAIEYYKRALKIVQEDQAEEEKMHLNADIPVKLLKIVLLLQNLAITCYCCGKFQEAQDYLAKAHKIIKSNCYDKLPGLASDLLNTLGIFYHESQQFGLSIKYFKKALKIAKEFYKGAPHPRISRPLNGLGNTNKIQGKYKEALQYYEEGLAIEKKLYQDQAHPNIAVSLNNLADIYINMKDYKNAKDYCQQAINMKKILYPNQVHPSLAFSVNILGSIYYHLKDYKTSIKYFEIAFEIRKEVYKEQPHPEIASSLNDLGEVNRCLKNYELALSLHQEALEMRKIIYGKPHSDVASSLQNLGGVYLDLEDTNQAILYFQQAHAMYAETLGTHHPDTLKVEHIIEGLYRKNFKQSVTMRNLNVKEQSTVDVTSNTTEAKMNYGFKKGFFNQKPVQHIEGNAHGMLINNIKEVLDDNTKNFKPFLDAIQEKSYSKALRRACISKNPRALELIRILLEYKDRLPIAINERAGSEFRAAIHYAAMNGNNKIYNLLVQQGADIELQDGKGISAAEYLKQYAYVKNANFVAVADNLSSPLEPALSNLALQPTDPFAMSSPVASKMDILKDLPPLEPISLPLSDEESDSDPELEAAIKLSLQK